MIIQKIPAQLPILFPDTGQHTKKKKSRKRYTRNEVVSKPA